MCKPLHADSRVSSFLPTFFASYFLLLLTFSLSPFFLNLFRLIPPPTSYLFSSLFSFLSFSFSFSFFHNFSPPQQVLRERKFWIPCPITWDWNTLRSLQSSLVQQQSLPKPLQRPTGRLRIKPLLISLYLPPALGFFKIALLKYLLKTWFKHFQLANISVLFINQGWVTWEVHTCKYI